MTEKRLTGKEIAEIVKMRGLGYSQKDIALRLDVSQSAIQYQLARINKRAKKDVDDNTFMSIVVGAGSVFDTGILLWHKELQMKY